MIIVLVVMGVVATTSIHYLSSAKENALDKEAQSSLKLIMAGERVFRMEVNSYYVSAAPHEQGINNNLKLYLPAAANRNWNYTTQANNAVIPPTCCAQAQRNGADARTWRLRNTGSDPVRGACP